MNTNIIHLFFERSIFMNYFYWITLSLYFVNIILNPLCRKSKNERSIKSTNENKEGEFEHSLFIVIMILFVLVILTLIKPVRILISFFSLFYVIYIFIISPIFDLPLKIVKDNNYILYTDDYLLLSYLILMNIYSFANNNILDKICTLSNNEYITQMITIFALLIMSFCIIYILSINLYWFIFHINTLFLSKLNKKLKQFVCNTREKYGIEKYENEINQNFKIKQFMSFIKLLFKLLLSILIDIIMVNILNVISLMIDCLLKITNNSNNILYRVSKKSIIISMFLTYIIIQINNSFSDSIIAIYELILTAIIVPIILEKLINQKIKKDIYK